MGHPVYCSGTKRRYVIIRTKLLIVCAIKLQFHGTDTDTDNDTDTDIIAVPRRATTSRFSLPRAGHARRSSQICPPTCPTRALFLARMSVGDARVYTCKRTVHDKLSCTRLQNYTIGASLKLVSVSVSVPWNSSLNRTWASSLTYLV